ncbi:MAG: ribosome biogenesis GTPase YlqF [Bacillota bacterium]
MSVKRIQWFPGHMAKAFRDFKKVFSLVHLIVEVADARIPITSRNPELGHLASHKPRILLLNKMDLADPRITVQWHEFWEKEGINVFPVNARLQQGFLEVTRKIKTLQVSNPSPFRLMIIGLPNTGKSSVLNSLCKNGRCKTGNKPGTTRGKQWITTPYGWELLDTPGLMQPGEMTAQAGVKLAAAGVIPDDLLGLEELALDLIRVLKEKYALGDQKAVCLNQEADEYAILKGFGLKQGCLAKRGEVDLHRTAGIFMRDFRNGRLGRFTLEWPQDFYPSTSVEK